MMLKQPLAVLVALMRSAHARRIVRYHVGWRDRALRRWARSHPAMVLAGVLLPLKLALFYGLARLVLANL